MGQLFLDSMVLIAVQHLWQSIFCLTIVCLLIRACPEMTSELRSWLWLSAFVMATLMPFMIFLPVSDEGGILKGGLGTNFVSESGSLAGSVQKMASIPLYYWVGLVWLTGVIIQLIRFGRSVFHTVAIIKAAKPLPRSMARLVRLLDRKVPVYCSDQIFSPMVTGFRRQVILLPKHMVEQADPAEFFNILAHEYGHIHRNDVRIMVLQRMLSTVYWWNPILHLIVENLNEAREMACDERAVITTGGVQHYAQSLLSNAEKMIQTKHSPMAAGIFSTNKTLTQRIERLKNMNINSIKQGKRASVLWSVGIISIALSTSFIFTPRLALADKPPIAHKNLDYIPLLLNVSEIKILYPKVALEQKLEGHVVLMFDIAMDGTTINHTIQETSNEIFNESALDAARKFIFKPHPDRIVASEVRHRINFNLN